jgi:uncharacterized protein
LRKISIISVIIFCLTFGVFAQKAIPEKPDSWVNDYTNLLDANQERILSNKLDKLEKATSTQIFLAILDKIPEDYYLDDYTVKMFEKWNPGRKNENNGVLIVLFTGDRKIRIEVGYGLEGVLTDLQAGRVIDDVMKPEFKKGDYFTGLNNGIDVIISAVKGEYTIPVEGKSRSKKSNWFSLIVIFFIIISVLRRFGGRGTTVSRKGSRYSRTALGVPFFFGGGGSSFGGGGGGFSGGFGGLSGGGGASGSW